MFFLNFHNNKGFLINGMGGGGKINGCSYFMNAARYLFWHFPICLLCSNIFEKQTTFNMYFFNYCER